MKKILVDGRVFSTLAYNRGMGRYVSFLIDLLKETGHHITILLFRNCFLPSNHPIIKNCQTQFAGYDADSELPSAREEQKQLHEFTAYLSELIIANNYDAYIDSTPFLSPRRLDLFSCAVISVCYDFIPLRNPESYLTQPYINKVYYNGLIRLKKSDHIICISETVQDEAMRYLAIPKERLSVIKPSLEPCYLKINWQDKKDFTKKNYIFSILGSHKSKNPIGSINIYKKILELKQLDIHINVPTKHQIDTLKETIIIPSDIYMTTSITDEEKYRLQSQASVIAHLSLEEGFGIPLLEAIFLRKKILALDISINREILDKSNLPLDSNIFLLDPKTQDINLENFQAFLNTNSNPEFFAEIQQYFFQHWQEAPSILDQALHTAIKDYRLWCENLQFKIFSSLPGNSCGVADYSVAYSRSASGPVMFFFSEGEPENISYLHHLKIGSYLDFERFSSHFPNIPGLYNLAVSSALLPGIHLMHKLAKSGDAILIHERRCLEGLKHLKYESKQIDKVLLKFASASNSSNYLNLQSIEEKQSNFNTKSKYISITNLLNPAWFLSQPARKISHLPPAVLQKVKELSQDKPGSIINELESIESTIDFVPLGIDDRRAPGILRKAKQIRILRQIQSDDIVIGHFGLILDGLKKLWDIVTTFINYVKERESKNLDHRKIFFFLIGKIIDIDLFNKIERAFKKANLSDRLFHANPVEEQDFDAEILACNAVVCFRVQTRGQVSHILVRSLSLGTPVLVNAHSGYSYDSNTTVDDDNLSYSFAKTLDRVFDFNQLNKMRYRARQEYEVNHRGDSSLKSILEIN